jgi:hypothetical protein
MLLVHIHLVISFLIVRSATLLFLHESVGVAWNWLTMPLPLIRVLLSSSVLLSLTMIAANGKFSSGNKTDVGKKKKVK